MNGNIYPEKTERGTNNKISNFRYNLSMTRVSLPNLKTKK